MERVDSCQSTLSSLDLPTEFYVGDRVRRAGTGVSGTVRYVGSMVPKDASPDEAKRMLSAGRSYGSIESLASTGDVLQSLNNTATRHHQYHNVSSTGDVSTSSGIQSPSAPNAAPVYIGVEWDTKVGKNDGSVEGHRYFQCDAGYGSLLRPSNLNKGLALSHALHMRYGSSTVRQETGPTAESVLVKTQTRAMQLGPAIGYRDPETGAFSKVVSCDCTANEQLGLVSCVGPDLASLFPNLRQLSIASTLFASWEEIKLLCTSLTQLQSLDISRNKSLGPPSRSVAFSSCDDDTTKTQQQVPLLSTTVTELRMCDMGLITPQCVSLILKVFPALESLFAARNSLCIADEEERARVNHKNDDDNGVDDDNSNGSSDVKSKLKYLNVEGNIGIRTLREVAHIIGPATCRSLTALNVSATFISDAPFLPACDPATIPITGGGGSGGTNSAPSSQRSADPSSSITSGGSAAPATPSTSPSSLNARNIAAAGGTSAAAAAAVFGSDDAEKSTNNDQQQLQNSSSTNSPHRTQPLPPPLFPALQSLFMSNVPVKSWMALSRIMHHAANPDLLQDVHFSTVKMEVSQQQQQQQVHHHHQHHQQPPQDEQHLEEPQSMSAATSMATTNDNYGDDDVDDESLEQSTQLQCFLPEDFRDRRRLCVAFMPKTVLKFNRSEISSVERSSAIQRSIPTFAEMVKKKQRVTTSTVTEEEGEDQQITSAEEQPVEYETVIDHFLFGQLPFHIQRSIALEDAKERDKVAKSKAGAQGGGGGGGGFIFRPETGPRRMVNELSVHLHTVFVRDKDHITALRKEFFASIVGKRGGTATAGGGGGGGGEDDFELESSSSSCASASSPSHKKRLAPLTIDVRWDTQELKSTVRKVLGMSAPDETEAMAAASAKKTPIVLFHIDRELAQNPGAVAKGLHCKELARDWEKLHMSKFAEGDDLVVCVGP